MGSSPREGEGGSFLGSHPQQNFDITSKYGYAKSHIDEHNTIFAILLHGFSSVLKKKLKTGTKIMAVAMKLKDACSLKEKI